MPQPVHASQTYSDLALRPGDFSPAGVGSEDWAAASDEFIAPPVSASALWAASGGSGASAFVVPAGRGAVGLGAVGERLELRGQPEQPLDRLRRRLDRRRRRGLAHV